MKLFVRIPTHDSVCGALVPWLAWIARAYPDADISITYSHGYGVAWARNRIVDEFMESASTHLWMVDSDVLPPCGFDLVEAAKEHPVVAAPYQAWRGEKGVSWHVYGKAYENGTFRSIRPHAWPDEPFWADAAGLGCCIIKRSVFESLGPEPFRHENLNSLNPTGEDFEFFADIEGVTVVPAAMARHLSTCDLLEVEEWVKSLLVRLEGKLKPELA